MATYKNENWEFVNKAIGSGISWETLYSNVPYVAIESESCKISKGEKNCELNWKKNPNFDPSKLNNEELALFYKNYNENIFQAKGSKITSQNQQKQE